MNTLLLSQQQNFIPKILLEPDQQSTVVEESSFLITSSATGTYANYLLINLSSVSDYASSWLTIYDEWRLKQVQFRFHSRVGSATSGALCMYLERDTTDANVSTLSAAYRQQESQSFRPWDDFVTAPKLTTLQWNPKDPNDYEYNNSTTGAVFRLCIVGEGLPISTNLGSIQLISRIQFRGRTAV